MRDINRIEEYLKELEKIKLIQIKYFQLIFCVLNKEKGDYWKEDDETLKMFKEVYKID